MFLIRISSNYRTHKELNWGRQPECRRLTNAFGSMQETQKVGCYGLLKVFSGADGHGSTKSLSGAIPIYVRNELEMTDDTDEKSPGFCYIKGEEPDDPNVGPFFYSLSLF